MKQLILGGTVLTPAGPRQDAAIVLENGIIASVEDAATAKARYRDHKTVDAGGMVVVPGLVNTHTHVSMGFFRGLTHDWKPSRPDRSMIEDVFFPAERALKKEWMTALSYGCILDGIRSGVTCFVDAYFWADEVAKAFETLKVRAFVGEHIADLGGPVAAGHAHWEKTKSWITHWPHGPLVKPCAYAHATDTVSRDLLTDVAQFARANDLPFHMHLAQTRGERERVRQREGISPVLYADQCGALTPRTLAVHLVSCDQDDIRLLKERGVTGVLCPVSEVIYETLPPLKALWESGLGLALGTDCAASNDRTDILSELHSAALFLKNAGVSPSPRQLLAMVTAQPARVLGLPGLGSIAPGAPADLVFLETDITTLPNEQVEANLIYSFTSRHVRDVMINGEWVLKDWTLKVADEAALTLAYRDAVRKVWDAVKSSLS